MAKVLEYLLNEGSGQWTANAAGAGTNPAGSYAGNGERFKAMQESAYYATLAENNGLTLTDDYTAAPVAGAMMSRAQSGGTNSYLGGTITLAAGTYTLSAYVKSNGSDVTFRMGYLGVVSTFTATSTTQRFSKTFTVTAGSYLILAVWSNGVDAFDLSVWGVRIDAGSSPAAYNPATFDLVLGKDGGSNANDPTWVTGGVSLNGTIGSAFCAGVGGAALSISTISVYVCCKQTGAGSNWGAMLSARFADHLFCLNGGDGTTAAPRFEFNNTAITNAFTHATDTVPHVWCGTYDGTTLSLYCDGLLIKTGTATLSAISVKHAILGAINNFAAAGEFYYAAVYDSGHDAATVVSTTRSIRTTVAAKGVTLGSTAAFLVSEGDSISTESATQFNGVMRANLAPKVPMRGFGTGGATVSILTSRAASVDAAFAQVPPSVRRILVLLIGANDMGFGDSAATFVANLKTYSLARKAATLNLKIVLLPVLPRTLAGFNTTRNSANTLIAADTSFYDRLVTADTSMWADAAASDASKYGDGLHPTTAGHALIEPFVRTEVQAVLDAAVPSWYGELELRTGRGVTRGVARM